MERPLLEARGIGKSFPGVRALDDVNLTLAKGSIHALLGENGAGKSTLIKILTGVHRLDEGELLLDGQPVRFADPHAAIAAGVGVVHQERNLIPRFSVAENIMLERLGPSVLSKVDQSVLQAEAKRWLDLLELDVDPATPVGRLSAAKMQLVEIAKALSLRSRVLLMDEPTASLTPHETTHLFALLERLKRDGVTIVFVSHKLEEVLQICDSVTVLRDGRNACQSQSMAGMGRQDLVRLMIGRNEQIPAWAERDRTTEPVVLQLTDVSTMLGHKNVSLTLHAGEILGLYGLVGAGRSELAKCLIGLFPIASGTVAIDGKTVAINSVSEALHRHGLGYVSEDRKGEGLVLAHSVLANAGITVWSKLAGLLGYLKDGTVRSRVSPAIERLEVKTPSLAQQVGLLSGGNQQKVSVAKWLAAGVKILIVDEPSVGIDIKTKAYLHELLRALAEDGTSILLITSDMPEMITLADRISVMDGYRVTGTLVNNRDYRQMSEGIMRLIHGEEPAEDRVVVA
ncbi:MAG TPA: sugar ABC transporter ATP-binding protein [Geminicoccus sp.]|jgi:ribose transport system ATP-binding protein|uniref:sugar ABC transporter ATP-binding protein n=1 Tax=Geminicoccus sp. TaxID=2024832 RepID=UPI002E37E827|nr:sugar ABC transporter ATP-binding protein [Geminicoccus sp.]HEX2526315.1 sugar ABC transporter ATP-binding protein [Geminicoccus sp.]